MSGATSVTVMISLSGGRTFNTASFSGTFFIDFSSSLVIFTRQVTTSIAIGTISPLIVTPGGHSIRLQITSTVVSPSPPSPPPPVSIGTVSYVFNDSPPTTVSNVDLSTTAAAGPNIARTAFTAVTISCIHGSSKIITKNGLKRIDQLKPGEEVLSGDGLDEYAKIKSIVQCWIRDPGPDHDAIIFEPDSLGLNEPSERLIIDPGHPMCTKQDFLINGKKSLKPAGSFLDPNNNKIYVRKWTDPIIQEDQSVRFDLVLKNPYSSYIANNIIVKSYGYYDHRYKDLI